MRVESMKGKMLRRAGILLAMVMAVVVLSPFGLRADKKKKADDKAATEAKIKAIDYSYICWPNPPAIARIKYVNWYASDKQVRNMAGNAQKQNKWMDRLAGTQSSDEVFKMPFQLIQPYGLAVDSLGSWYIAESKVGAVVIFNYAWLVSNSVAAVLALSIVISAFPVLSARDGPVLDQMRQLRGAIGDATLPLRESLLIAWPLTVGLIAGVIVLFVAAYVAFQRQEVRA